MSSDVSGSGLGRLLRLAGVALGLLALLVLLPTALTYINPGHVGIVIHRVGGGVDPTPLSPGSTPGTRSPRASRSIRPSCRRWC